MNNEELLKAITEKHREAVKGSTDRFGVLEVQVERSKIAEVVKTLRDDAELSFNMLIDLVSIDYSLFAGWTGDRFAVAYVFKALDKGHRLQLKVAVPEGEPVVPSVSSLYKN